jgi:hypothetical protein
MRPASLSIDKKPENAKKGFSQIQHDLSQRTYASGLKPEELKPKGLKPGGIFATQETIVVLIEKGINSRSKIL